MSWKGCEISKSWPNLRHYPVICLERPIITTKSLSIAGFRTDILTQTSRIRCRHGNQLITGLWNDTDTTIAYERLQHN